MSTDGVYPGGRTPVRPGTSRGVAEANSSTVARSYHIAVVAYTEYPSDGRVRFEAEALAKEGHQVCAISARAQGGKAEPNLRGVRLVEIPLSIRRGGRTQYIYQYVSFFLLSSAMLLRLRAKEHFDFIHVHNLPDFQVLCGLLPKLSGAAVLLDMHESMPELLLARLGIHRSSLWYRLAVLIQTASAKFADQVIVPSDALRELLISRGIPGERVTVLYNSDHAPMETPSAEAVRQRLRLPIARMIVHAGGVNPERDLDTLVRAIALLPRDLGIHLVVAGTGNPRFLDRLKRLALELDIANRVHFVGRLPLEEARSLMSMSEVGVVTMVSNPNTQLAWPIRAGHYLHLRKPLVVPDLPHLRRILGRSARYYTPGDSRSLAVEIGEILSRTSANPKIHEETELLRNRFEWDRMRGTLLKTYEELANPHANG